jgi:AhpD family alkylhydroperoxidase
MSRIPAPASIEGRARRQPPPARGGTDPARRGAQPVPAGANSPAELEGYLGLSDVLGKGTLPAATCERVALAVSEINGCDYCLSAHTYLGKHVAKLDDAEIAANREGSSTDPKAAVAVRFAAQVVRQRGHIDPDDLQAVRDAGYDDAQIIESVLHVALNTWTNYINTRPARCSLSGHRSMARWASAMASSASPRPAPARLRARCILSSFGASAISASRISRALPPVRLRRPERRMPCIHRHLRRLATNAG